MSRLTADKAHRAMRAYLERQFARAPDIDVAQVLSDRQMPPDGRSAYPAAWREWLDCVEAVLAEDSPPRKLAGE
jgi:hypothetical protein